MTRVLGIDLYDNTFFSSVSELIEICLHDGKKNRCVSATGAHGLVVSQKDRGFRDILDNFYWNLPDGMPAVWVMKMKGAKQSERCYGPDFFKNVISETSGSGIIHYFVGGKEGVAEKLKLACADKFENKNIVGIFSPPFREMTDDEIRCLADEINLKNTDIVWVGLSTPKQEVLAKRLSGYLKVHFIITVGAAFDYHTGLISRPSKFIQRIGMEWFFRLCQDPKRLFWRYLRVVPLFIQYNLKEFMSSLWAKIIRKGK